MVQGEVTSCRNKGSIVVRYPKLTTSMVTLAELVDMGRLEKLWLMRQREEEGRGSA